jgi:hypothetical protein
MAVQGVGRYGGIKVYAVLRDDGAEFAKNNNLEALFHVDDPGPRVPIKKGKFLDVNEALEVVRFDIQYCDWRARHDLLTIMVLHNKVLKFSSVSALNANYYMFSHRCSEGTELTARVPCCNRNAGGRGPQPPSEGVQVDRDLEERACRATAGAGKSSQSGMLQYRNRKPFDTDYRLLYTS